jgi:hypothetical protein
MAGYVWDAAKPFLCTETASGMTEARTWVHERRRTTLRG